MIRHVLRPHFGTFASVAAFACAALFAEPALANGHFGRRVVLVPVAPAATTTTVVDSAPATRTIYREVVSEPETVSVVETAPATRTVYRVIERELDATPDPAASAQAPAPKAAAPKAVEPAATTVIRERYIIREVAPAPITRQVVVREVPVQTRVVQVAPVTTYIVRDVATPVVATSSPTYLLVRPKHRLFGGW